MKLFITNYFEQKMTNKLEKLILENNIEIMQSTPSIMSFHLENATCNGFSKLKYVMLAGEPLPKLLVQKIKTISSKCIVYNGYGPSETTIFSSVEDVTDEPIITIGKPIHNTQFYILDKDLNLLPKNIVGELYISGDGVGNGYLYREDLTKERYISNPFIKNSVMYKTGDCGIWLNNGKILYKGRIDNQIKLRGLRIELNEIEQKINSFSAENTIKTAVVVKEIQNKVTLNAFISSTQDIDIDKLKKYLLELLPNYMIPSTFTVLKELPFTPNGKIDRQALKNYQIKDSSIKEQSHSKPRNKIETVIIEAIKNKLNILEFGIDDNVFDYGADSLSIINILTDLFKERLNLKVNDFYKFPTVREIYDNVIVTNKTEDKFTDTKYLEYDTIVKFFKTSTNCKKTVEPHSIFLTGATGFLGAHILAELFENSDKITHIYCAIRNGSTQTAKEKLLSKMNFYFGNKYISYISKYVTIIEADINKPNLGMTETDMNFLIDKIDTVIHCAANVKHYGNYSDFEQTNVNGTKNIIALCKKASCSLHYMSTMTISGNYLLKQKNSSYIFSENSYFVNQNVDANVYAKSKLIAESLIIKEINKGLKCTIYRIGDLTGRYTDGAFQENINENGIYLRLKSILEIGAIPNTLQNNLLEFTPVDYAAKAFCNILWSTNNSNRIFHIYNPNMITLAKVIEYAKFSNYYIDLIEKGEFLKRLNELSKNEDYQKKFLGLINDFTKDNDFIYNYTIKTDNTLTCKYLENLGFSWPQLSKGYFTKLIEYMNQVKFI